MDDPVRRDKLVRAHSTLKSLLELQENAGSRRVEARFVEEFHAALAHLDDLDYAVEDMKIRADDFRPMPVGPRPMNQPQRLDYSDMRVDRRLFMMKVCQAFNYFDLTVINPNAAIRYNGPRK